MATVYEPHYTIEDMERAYKEGYDYCAVEEFGYGEAQDFVHFMHKEYQVPVPPRYMLRTRSAGSHEWAEVIDDVGYSLICDRFGGDSIASTILNTIANSGDEVTLHIGNTDLNLKRTQ